MKYKVGDIVVQPTLTYNYLYEIVEIKGVLIKVKCLGDGHNRLSYSFESDIRLATKDEVLMRRRSSMNIKEDKWW